MPALTSLLAVAAAGVGTAVQVSQQKKAEKAAQAAAKLQETRALEAGKLKGPKDPEVKVKIGADDSGLPRHPGTPRPTSPRPTTKVSRAFGSGPTASRLGGL